MNTRVCSTLALAAVLFAGCVGPQNAATKGAIGKCLPDTVSQDTCEYSGPPGSPNKAICRIHVGGTAGTPVVYPYDLFITKRVPDVTIVWTLMDPGAEFRDNNDGPNFGSNPNFTDGGTTDNPNGADPPHGRPAKHYRIKTGNGGGGQSHPYTITFKPAIADSIRCDPTITNGGG
jgi:hypothetical protein